MGGARYPLVFGYFDVEYIVVFDVNVKRTADDDRIFEADECIALSPSVVAAGVALDSLAQVIDRNTSLFSMALYHVHEKLLISDEMFHVVLCFSGSVWGGCLYPCLLLQRYNKYRIYAIGKSLFLLA